ncbi:caspase-1-like [Tachyglossus aculeatus]|uniref:caspase-1-like n=1 Tax=Tachyglossus aculeatus TaxID=9261 RepID=UPI0018F6423D|nr:caspase-1-like [Tachyglossus aculeatus]
MATQLLKDRWCLIIESLTHGMISGLLDDLLQTQVINQEEMDTVREENQRPAEKSRALLNSVIPKGDLASQIFIDALCKRNPFIAAKLGLSTDRQGQSSNTQLVAHSPVYPAMAASCSAPQALQAPKALTESHPDGPVEILRLCTSEEREKLQKENAGEIYPVLNKTGRKRQALIICNIKFDELLERVGAELDIKGMKKLLEDLDYNVQIERNLSATEMESTLKLFAQQPEHKFSDSTFLVFMSHGILEGICGTKFKTQDPDVLYYSTIFRIFNNLNCPGLRDKPKIIIVQACRGENEGMALVSDSLGASAYSSQDLEDLENDAIHRTHVEKDLIAFCSSTPDNVSWRDPKTGSLFITQLIKCFQNHAWGCDLESLFMKVQGHFETPKRKLQMPTRERATLTKRFFLFPGY